MDHPNPTLNPDPHAQWRPKHNMWIIALTVTMATFMEVLDTSIANVSLPHIAGNLSAGQDEATWVLTSYLVANAIVLPLSGFLSALIGRKRFYMSCVALFTVSSLMCGLAPNLGMLVLFRILQGVGGGGLQPSEQAILMDTFPRAKRGMGMAVYGVAVVTAPIIGPTLGGYITDNFSWRWIFLINIPVGILSLILTSRLVEDPPFMRRRSFKEGLRIDYIGLGLIAVGLGALQIILDKGEREDWFDSRFIVALSVVSAAALMAAVVWEWRTREPIVDIHLLRDRNFLLSNVLMFFLGFVLYGSTMLLPLFLQTMMGYTAMLSGLALSPGAILTMFMMPIVGMLLSRFEPRWLVGCGLTVLAISMIHMSGFTLGINYSTAMEARALQSFGLAFLFVPINQSAYHYLPREKNNNASGIINLARNLGGSVGIAFVTTMLARHAQVHQTTLISHLTPMNAQMQSMVQGLQQTLIARGSGAAEAHQQALAMIYGMVQRQATAKAFLDDFRIMGYLIICVIPLIFLMKKIRPGKGEMMAH